MLETLFGALLLIALGLGLLVKVVPWRIKFALPFGWVLLIGIICLLSGLSMCSSAFSPASTQSSIIYYIAK